MDLVNQERIELAKKTFTERQKKFIRVSDKITDIMENDLDWYFCHLRKYYKRSLLKDEDEMPSGCIVIFDEYYILAEYTIRGKKIHKIICLDRASYNRTRGRNAAVIRKCRSYSMVPYISFVNFCNSYKDIIARQIDNHTHLYAYEIDMHVEGDHYPRGLSDAHETIKTALKQFNL